MAPSNREQDPAIGFSQPEPNAHNNLTRPDTYAVEASDGESPIRGSEREPQLPPASSNVVVGSDGAGETLSGGEPPSPMIDEESMDEFEDSEIVPGTNGSTMCFGRSYGVRDVPGDSCDGRRCCINVRMSDCQLGGLAILSAAVSWIVYIHRLNQLGCFESVVHVPTPSIFPQG